MANLYTPRSTTDARALRLRIETEDPLYFGMKKLKMRGRDLERIPASLFKLDELEVLDLSPDRQSCLTFRLLVIPPAIKNLHNLRVLVLDTNEMQEVPQEITSLKHLERFALSNNHLKELPDGFNNLQELKSLHLANNEFEEFPQQICELTSLEFLDMSDNELSVLPPEIVMLTELNALLLFYNKIARLPDCICEMTQLRCMWIGNNLLRELPRNFGKLKNLDWGERYTSSTMDGNPLISPPIEICRMGPSAIERYLNTSRGDLGRSSSRSDGGTASCHSEQEEELRDL